MTRFQTSVITENAVVLSPRRRILTGFVKLRAQLAILNPFKARREDQAEELQQRAPLMNVFVFLQ